MKIVVIVIIIIVITLVIGGIFLFIEGSKGIHYTTKKYKLSELTDNRNICGFMSTPMKRSQMQQELQKGRAYCEWAWSVDDNQGSHGYKPMLSNLNAPVQGCGPQNSVNDYADINGSYPVRCVGMFWRG